MNRVRLMAAVRRLRFGRIGVLDCRLDLRSGLERGLLWVCVWIIINVILRLCRSVLRSLWKVEAYTVTVKLISD